MSTNARLFDYSRDGSYWWKIPDEMSWKEYIEVDSKSIRIDKYAGTEEQVVIPDKIMGLEVRAIGERAFEWNKWIERVVIPHSVIVIGESTFYSCDSLYCVEIGGRVIEIGDSAFAGCETLYSVIMGGSVTTIGKWAFAYTPLDSIVIPNSVKTIGEGAFAECKNLKTIQITNLDTIDINGSAFNSCEAVEKIYLSSSNSANSKMTSISKFQLTTQDIPALGGTLLQWKISLRDSESDFSILPSGIYFLIRDTINIRSYICNPQSGIDFTIYIDSGLTRKLRIRR